MNRNRMADPFPPTPAAFHDGVTDALHNLTEAPAHRRHTAKRALLAAAAVAVFALGTALATGGFGRGVVDWFGTYTEDTWQYDPAPTPAPEGADDAYQQFLREEAILDQAPEGEYWYVQTDTGGTGQPIRRAFQSLDELNTFLAEKGAPFLRAEKLPDGYAFRAAECTFYFTAEAIGRGTVSEETLPGGMTLRKFIPADEADFLVLGYSLQLWDERGVYLSLDVDLTGAEDGVEFGVDEGDTCEVVEVSGMERALLLNRSGHFSLSMLDEAVGAADGYRDPLVWDDYGYPPPPCDAAWYSIRSNKEGREAILAFAEGLK